MVAWQLDTDQGSPVLLSGHAQPHERLRGMWGTHKVVIPSAPESEICGETDLHVTVNLYLPGCVVLVTGLISWNFGFLIYKM